jgi:hypothetical protein
LDRKPGQGPGLPFLFQLRNLSGLKKEVQLFKTKIRNSLAGSKLVIKFGG